MINPIIVVFGRCASSSSGSMMVMFAFLALFGRVHSNRLLFYCIVLWLTADDRFFSFMLGVLLCDGYVQSRITRMRPFPLWLGVSARASRNLFGCTAEATICPPKFMPGWCWRCSGARISKGWKLLKHLVLR